MENPQRDQPTAAIVRRIRVDAGRVFYCGDLGRTAMRHSGAVNLYVSLRGPLRFRLETGSWQMADCVAVLPYVKHQIHCDERIACDFMIEPETVDLGSLPEFIHGESGAADVPLFVQRMREAAHGAPLTAGLMDAGFFDRPLARRELDPRIERAVIYLQQSPNSPVDAGDFAAREELSTSRFLHLFKEQTGCSYRRFRAWKRARMLLPLITRPQNLAKLAQDIGYPDSTHFSHSIRRFYGLTPGDILRGCRRIQLVQAVGGDRLAAA